MDVLGVDVGGVIIDRVNDRSDTSFFSNNYLKSRKVPSAFRILRQLVRQRFGDNVHIVSKCGERTEEKTLAWFARHRFYKHTGILPENVHFCRTREGKGPICEKLGISHFIDDRLEVLSYLDSVPHKFLLNGSPREMQKFSAHAHEVQVVSSWQEIANQLM